MSRSRVCRRPALAATMMAVFFEWGARAKGPSSDRDSHPAIERAIWRAVDGAQRRLSRPACQRVFGDFFDDSGVPLADKLAVMGRTAGDHLATLVFVDGSGRPSCEPSGVLATTSPGSRTVFVCGSRFRLWQQLEPSLAEAIIIHEELHTLGLGEDPPSSGAITRRVVKRCGR